MEWKIGDKCVFKHLDLPIVDATIKNIVKNQYGTHYVIEIINIKGQKFLIGDAHCSELFKDEKDCNISSSMKALKFLNTKLEELDAERNRVIDNIKQHEEILKKYS